MIKEIINSALGKAGFKLVRATGTISAFAEQARLLSIVSAPLIIDCGAHTGATALRYRKIIPRARLIAFEPFPEAFESLKANTSGDAQVEIYCAAVAEKTERLKLNCNRLSETNSLLESDIRGDSYWGEGLLNTQAQIEVEAVALDEFCEQKRVDRIDILKLDIQGAEYRALQGATKMLEAHAIALIYTEVLIMPTYGGQRKLWELLAFLDKRGYELFNFYHFYQKHGQLIQADALFIGKGYKRQLGLFGNPHA